MKIHAFIPAVFVALLTLIKPASNVAAAPGGPTRPASPYAIMESLIGGVWVGELPREKNSPPSRIELRFEWAANRQGLCFDSEIVQGARRSPYTSGMYAWNAAARKFAIFYTDYSGSLVEGPVTPEDNTLVHELTISDAAGKTNVAQVRLTKVSTDVFTNTIYLRKDGAWVKFAEVRYVRER